ncbi:GNAT family N-acetyltransferase [Brachybacterium ginsengisoli]|uniref:GNAT family N-acetyltransferase n=1 Tax=Brachybacterium ginsengisoli TaxID=1331682 RepID=A0A291GXR9_9MICO|nr:GNAT family N-acetyltransferase [Brachybacterium ginsengisoli]ATG55021.1 GNAT family N-acetyltransferase [Brachybacterium ginsengisoli]
MMTTEGVELLIHRVEPRDWAAHRDLRLDMLAADPEAFWADPAEARARAAEQWREEIAGPRIHLQARRGTEVLGGIALLPAGYTPEHQIPEDRAHIVSLWVRPEVRGTGISRPLLVAAARLSLDLGRPDLRLDVDAGNDSARRLYERLGFVATGARDPRESNGSYWVEYAIDASALVNG